MNRANFPHWSDEVDKAVVELIRVRNQIDSTVRAIKRRAVTSEMLSDLGYNLGEVLSWWTGHTYVGVEKDKKLKKSFQYFYESLYDFLLVCRNSNISVLHNFAEHALYQGTVYRYLGCSSNSRLSKVAPKEVEYDGVFVSWSKNAVIPYIESKLCGTLTRVTCNISGDKYGIDLTAFGVSKADESEVVFPTLKECVTNVEYADSFVNFESEV